MTDRQTDEQQSHSLRVPFFVELWNSNIQNLDKSYNVIR